MIMMILITVTVIRLPVTVTAVWGKMDSKRRHQAILYNLLQVIPDLFVGILCMYCMCNVKCSITIDHMSMACV